MLNNRQRAVLDTLLPSGGHPTLGLGLFDAGFDAFYEDFEGTAQPSMVWGFKAALFAASWLSPVLILRLPPLSRLERPDRERALEALGKSRFYLLRQLLLLLKAVCAFCYGADPRVRDALGFPRS